VHSAQPLASLCTGDWWNNGNFGQYRNKTGCFGCTASCLFTLCSVCVSALQNVFSNNLCESTTQWETCQIFKGQTVGALLAWAPIIKAAVSKWWWCTQIMGKHHLRVFVDWKPKVKGSAALWRGKKVKQSHYRPEQAQRVDRGIVLTFHDLGARRGVSAALRSSCFTPGKDPVPTVQEAG
jgi:hypothetical protein